MDKEKLILEDLCGRLPYGVHFVSYQITYGEELVLFDNEEMKGIVKDAVIGTNGSFAVKKCRPYLRPMESMTDEEIEELKKLCSIHIPTDSPTIAFEEYGILVFTHHLTNNTYSFGLNLDVIDWFNKNMFDYRGLIPKGLALEAPKGMYRED